MSDDLSNDFIEGFLDRSIARSTTFSGAEKAQAEARKPLVEQVQETYPEVDVAKMEKDQVYGATRMTSRYLRENYFRERPAVTAGIKAAAGGIRDGWQEAAEAVHMAGYALSGQKQFLQRPPTIEQVKDEVPDLPEIDVGDGTPEQITKGIFQFLSTGGPAGGLLKKAGAKGLATTMGGGAVGDATAFNPEDGNLFTLMREFDMDNEFTQWMDSSEDGQFEGRLKNALEGAGIGVAFEGILRTAKAFKASTSTAAGSAVAADEGEE